VQHGDGRRGHRLLGIEVHYKFWRPSAPSVKPIRTAIRHTAGDPSFTPLARPPSNLPGANFTPPFPAYPSGHATFGGALFQTLRRFYGTDNIASPSCRTSSTA
jgi:hypothetical protein